MTAERPDLRRVVVVGASLAGLRAAETLRRKGFTGELTLVGEEAHPPYDRPPLSKGFAAGAVSVEALRLRQVADLDATWRLGERAVSLDPRARVIGLHDGAQLPYDGLVVATGARPRRLPGLPDQARGLHMLRTLDDAVRLRTELVGGARVVIVGGGFIGAELASTTRELGLSVTVVTPLPMMVTALGPLAEAAAERARRHGVEVVEGVGVTGVVVDDGRVRAVELSDGSTVAADVAVVAVGVIPNTDWLIGSGVRIESGVVCDATLAVCEAPDVVAAGDVACWPHPALRGELLRLEHWTNATEQAAAAAERLRTGSGSAFATVPSFWSDQYRIRLQGIGLPGRADSVDVVDGDPAGDRFVAEYRRDGELVGAITAGSVKALLPYRRELMRRFASAAGEMVPAQ
jgi:3-phenylpropionate/trans-cinnamate dioxygenase ferredoxin reductase component